MASKTLLVLASIIETSTGLALMVQPALVIRLLVGGDVSGDGIAVGRMAGFALIAFGYACWPWNEAIFPALRAMLIYNTLALLYFIYLRLEGEFAGTLLLPAIAIHAILTLLFAWACWNQAMRSKSRREREPTCR